MSDDLDDLLGGLASAPIAPLAEADLVRRRGAQRRTRLRVGTALASVVLLAGAGGIALAAAGGDNRVVRQPIVTTSDSATPEPTTSSSGASTAAALLTPADADTVNPYTGGADWVASKTEDDAEMLTICATGDGYGGSGSSHQLNRSGVSVLSRVVRTGDAAGARNALLQDAAQCPHGPDDDPNVNWWVGTSTDPEVVILHDGETTWVVVADGELYGLVRLPSSLSDNAKAWGHVALARMRQATTGSPHPAGFPEEVDTARSEAWAVYLTTTASATDPKLADTVDQAQRVGYFPLSGELTCDIGAPEGLHLDTTKTYYTVPLYFGSAKDAQQFVESFQPGVTGTVHVTLVCND